LLGQKIEIEIAIGIDGYVSITITTTENRDTLFLSLLFF
jgi:hypothetical protein